MQNTVNFEPVILKVHTRVLQLLSIYIFPKYFGISNALVIC